MGVLSSKLVISLIDQVSGPARAMSTQLKALNTLAKTSPGAAIAAQGKRFAQSFERFNGSVATPLNLGIAAIVASTQEFEKALVGVQIAGIADNLKEGRVNFAALKTDAQKTKEEAMRLSEALKISPTGLIQAGEAAAKMGLSADKLSTLMKMAGSINIQDNSLPTGNAAEFLGSLGINFGAGTKGFERGTGTGDYNADIERLTNQLLGIANMTRTSAGRLQEGLRQFAPLYASLGMTFLESSAMIGGMVQSGQLDVESGTALKSAAVRTLSPTAAAREAMLKSGIDRSKFMNLDAVSGGKAFDDLVRLTDVNLTKRQRAALKAKLIEGEQKKAFADEKWQQDFLRLYNKVTGAKTQEARDANLERMTMSLFTGGGTVDILGLFKEIGDKMAKGELTDAQLSKIFEGRHLSKYKALIKMLPEIYGYIDKLKHVTTEYTDAGNKLYAESSAGRWEGALAAMQRAFIRLRESSGITNLINSLAQLGDALAKAPPATVEALGKALVGLAVIGPVGMALSGAAAAIQMVGAAAKMAAVGVLALSTRLSALAGAAIVPTIAAISSSMASLSYAMAPVGPAVLTAGAASAAATTGFAGLAAAALPIAAVVAAIAVAGNFLYQNWSGIGAMLAGIGDGFMNGLGPARPLIEGIASTIGGLVDGLVSLLGPIDETGAAWRSWGEAIGTALAWPIKQLGNLVEMIGQVGTWLRDSAVGRYLLGDRAAAATPPGEQPGTPPTGTTGPAAAIASPAAPAGPPLPGRNPGAPSTTPAAPPAAAPSAAGNASGDLAAVRSQAETIVVTVRSAMDQVRAIAASVNLQAEGQRAAETYAAGIRAGLPSIRAAAAAMGAATRSAVNGSFSDGGVR